MNIDYFVVFQNGSYSALHGIESGKTIPEDSYILRKSWIGNRNYFESATYEFINSKEEISNLKMGKWELMYMSKEFFVTVKTKYTLYNHKCKSSYDFIEIKSGLQFIQHELFPKLQELCNIQDFEKYLLIKRIDNLEREVEVLKESLKISKKND